MRAVEIQAGFLENVSIGWASEAEFEHVGRWENIQGS